MGHPLREEWLDHARAEARLLTYLVGIDGKDYQIAGSRPPTEVEAREALHSWTIRGQPQGRIPSMISGDFVPPSDWVGALGLSVLYGTGLYLLIGLLRVTAWSLRTVRR